MTEKVPLKALLFRASRTAEQMFDKDGEVTAFWLAETAAGRQQTIITPMVFPPETSVVGAKEKLAAKMREHFKEHNAVRYAHASEAWMAPDGNYPSAEHPQRAEIVSLNADDGCECLMAKRDIVRPRRGKAYLTKLSKIERIRQPRGRLMDLLNDDIRPTSELADDEGTLFVTDVSGAPFQLLGRRGPTGELFVGSVFHPDLTTSPSIEDLRRDASAAGVEVVTGPRAERLIRGMQRRMNKH